MINKMSYLYTRGFHHIILFCLCCYSWHFSGLVLTSARKSIIHNILLALLFIIRGLKTAYSVDLRLFQYMEKRKARLCFHSFYKVYSIFPLGSETCLYCLIKKVLIQTFI